MQANGEMIWGMLEQVFVLHLCIKSSEETCNDLNQGITNDKIRNFAQTLKEYFAECDYPAIILAMVTGS